MTLAKLSIYYTGKNINENTTTRNPKIPAPTWNAILDLPDGSYSIANIEDYFKFIIKKLETLTENPPMQIYPNKIKNRITFKIKSGYKSELLTPETVYVDKDKDNLKLPKLESVEVVLVHCNLVKKDYQHTSKSFFTFAPNKQFGQLIIISPHSVMMMNTVNTEFSSVEVWFANQVSKALEIAGKCDDKYGKKLMDTETKTEKDAAKTASKRVVQKTAEANEI